MNKHALLHIPKSNYAYGLDEHNLCIRFRCAKGDLTKVEVVFADKFDMEQMETKEMKKVLTDELFDYYETTLNVYQSRYAYYFKLYDKNEMVYFTEYGIEKELNKELLHYSIFQFPYLHKQDTHTIPEWAKNAIFYQIFVERFNNGNKSNDPKEITKWGEKPNSHSYFGGDLKGITQKLDYLEDLGINALYLTPIFKANTNHKYDTEDYMQIDPEFGTKEDFKELVEKAHKKGIKIVLDAVFNHSGYEFRPFQDVLNNGEKSKYFDWFHIEGKKVTKSPSNYRRFAFANNMPKLNTSNEEVINYLIKVGVYWIKEFDIDGWRLDVSDEIDHEFWRKFRKAIKNTKEDAIILGENWHDAYPWLMGDQYDGIMNYAITKACLDYFAYGNTNAEEFSHIISNVLMRNSKQANYCMLNLLDSHDTARILTICGNDTNKLNLALTFIMSFVGMPCIFYGTETGIVGSGDPDCRKTFDWDEKSWNKSIYNYYKKLVNIRKNNKALTIGDVKFDYSKKLFIMERTYEDETVLVLLNPSNEIVDYSLLSKGAIDLLTDEKLENTKITIQPNEAKIYYIKK